MLLLRLKQAQYALNHGRLDEAFELTSSAGFREHQKGQKIIDQLVDALIERGQNHLSNQRFDLALADCHKSEKLAGRLEKVANLQLAISQAMRTRQLDQELNHQQAALARANIEKGNFSLGAKIATYNNATDNGAALQQQAELKRMELDHLYQKTLKAFNAGNLETAAALMSQIATGQQHNDKVSELLGKIKSEIELKARRFFEQGRLDLAQKLLQQFSHLVSDNLELNELHESLAQCRKAITLTQEGKFHQARQILLKLQGLYPKINWLKETLQTCTTAAKNFDEIVTGPLSRMVPDLETQKNQMPNPLQMPENSPGDAEPAQAMEAAQIHLPDRFLLQIDGLASFLVLQKPQITIGPVSHVENPDLGFVTQPDTPLRVIERVDEDYFLRESQSQTFTAKPPADKLLHSGDRLTLSPRCRLRFDRPNPASTTALLQFSAARFPRSDVRAAILMDREIIIGPDSSAHINTDQTNAPVILYINSSQCFCRTKEPVIINEQPHDNQKPLPMNHPIQIGSLRIVFTQT